MKVQSGRKLHEKVLAVLDKASRNEPQGFLLSIVAPTGYGKTVFGPMLCGRLRELSFAHAFIHVLPLRAIIRQFYLCTLLQSLTTNGHVIEFLRKEYGCKDVPEHIKNIVRRSIASTSDVAYQMGEELEALGLARKEPMLDARYVVTTLDSFIYNLFRVPVSEIFRNRKHYPIPRLRIFVGAVYFDEAHAVFEEERDVSTMYTAFRESLRVLEAMRCPVILGTASISIKALQNVLGDLRMDKYVVMLSVEDREEERGFGKVIEVRDRDFTESACSLRWRTEVLNEDRVLDRVKEMVSRGLRVFVACDSIKRAIKRFEKLREKLDSVILLHSLLTRGDREKALSKVDSASIVVATSVVEAGVNMDLDALVTDGTRPTSIVQRAGRVCRDIDRCVSKGIEPLLVVVREHSNERVLRFVEKNRDKVNWRIPFDYGEVKGYQELIKAMSLPREDAKLRNALQALSTPLFISSDTINTIVRKAGYALSRIPLAELLVCDRDEAKHLSPGEVYSRSLTISVDRLSKLILRGYVTEIAVFLDTEELKIVDWAKPSDFMSGNGDFDYTRFIDFMRQAMRKGFVPNVYFLLDPKHYEEGVGIAI